MSDKAVGSGQWAVGREVKDSESELPTAHSPLPTAFPGVRLESRLEPPNVTVVQTFLPPQEELVKIQAQYRTTLNALMAHAIKVSTGKMQPPQVFVASPAPPRPRRSRGCLRQPVQRTCGGSIWASCSTTRRSW